MNNRSLSRTCFRYIQSLPDLQYPLNHQQAVHCLYLLVTNALHHVPDVLTYMEHIRLQFVLLTVFVVSGLCTNC